MCKLASDHIAAPITTPSQPSITDLTFIPPTPLCAAAYAFAATRLHPAILAHSIRVFLYAQHIATLRSPRKFNDHTWNRRSEEEKLTLMFVAALFHDIGTVEEFNGEERFEVCGADAAVEWMRKHAEEMGESDTAEVWTAVACHTSPGIAEGISPLARIVRLAVLVDFDRPGLRLDMGCEGMSVELESVYKRGSIESVLGDAVVSQILGKSEEGRKRKAPGNSWPGGLWKGALEMRERGEEGVNAYF